MSFKENLLKKIRIDQMSEKVIASVGQPDSGKKIDKQSLKTLFDMGPFSYRKERDLDLYIVESDENKGKIVVLDNELALYKTDTEDIALRRSPTVKEMLSIRNAIKILNDSDVVLCKREESVRFIQKECIDMLDLLFNESDIEEIEKDGAASLEREYSDGVLESLSLFAELLGFVHPPKAFKISNHEIIGNFTRKETGEELFGPLVIYSIIHNTLKLIDEQISTLDKGKFEFFHNVAVGKDKGSAEGNAVFAYLKERVISNMDEIKCQFSRKCN